MSHDKQHQRQSAILGGVLATALVIVCSCSPTEPKVMTCPPGMARATQQNICILDTCGNGLLDDEESCDDGNQIDGDGCSSDCRSAEICGNAVVDLAVGELCDDGNTDPDDQCCSDCRSCPERAVKLLAEAPTPIIEDTPSAALPCRAGKHVQETQPSLSPTSPLRTPVDVGSLLVDLFLRQEEPAAPATPATLQFMSLPAPLAFEQPPFLADMPGIDSPAWLTDELARVRASAEELQQRLRFKTRAHKHLKRTEELLAEELQGARDMIAQLEQINAELHQYLGAECQQLPRGRSNGLQ